MVLKLKDGESGLRGFAVFGCERMLGALTFIQNNYAVLAQPFQ